ncbi:MAG: hypothetical protein ACKVX9_00490 [Blastocatellia bacterium]
MSAKIWAGCGFRWFLVLVMLGGGGLPRAIAQTKDRGHVIPEGTEIQLTLRDPVSSKLSEPGDEILAIVRRDVVADGYTLLKQGTEVIGRVTLAQSAKAPFKGGRLHITFDRIRIDGQEQKITAVLKSASDFTRDEKVKSDSEGTLKGGKDGSKTLSNVLTAGGVGMIGVTIAILAGAAANGGGGGGFGGFGGISQGGAIAGATVLGGSVIAGVFMTKGKEVKLDERALIRLRLERPISLE